MADEILEVKDAVDDEDREGRLNQYIVHE